MVGWWRLALVSPDGVALTQIVCMSASVIFPCTIKSRSSLLAPAHPGGPRKRAVKKLYVCMYKNLFRAAAYSLGCHDGAMIDCRLYRTFQSLTVNRTETVTSICREVSVAMSSKVLGRSMRNFVVHSS